MKKLVLVSGMVVSSLVAGVGSCSILSTDDQSAEMAFQSDINKCFNAYELFNTALGVTKAPVSIMTKKAGEDFHLLIYKKQTPECVGVTDVTYYLVDNKTGEKIPNTEKTLSVTKFEDVTFNVPNSYADVSVKFDYKVKKLDSTPHEVKCPSGFDWKSNLLPTSPQAGIFAKKDGWTSYKCYTYEVDGADKTDMSVDNFAIIPDKFEISFNNVPKSGSTTFSTIKAVDLNGDVTTNYHNSSINMDVVVDAQYAFEIKNGETKSAQFIFLNTGSQSLDMNDSSFSYVDADDTDKSCRTIEGKKVADVITSSKYWAGTGTDEKENTPKENTVCVDIKQNTKKDLHFHKMTW